MKKSYSLWVKRLTRLNPDIFFFLRDSSKATGSTTNRREINQAQAPSTLSPRRRTPQYTVMVRIHDLKPNPLIQRPRLDITLPDLQIHNPPRPAP